MSTIPRDPIDVADTGHLPSLRPTSQRDLNEIVWEFESAAESIGIARPPRAELHDLCRHVAAFTAELFPAEPDIKVKNDPEIPSDLYFVFTVAATGTVDDLAARYDQWHRRVIHSEGRWHGLFRLAIDRR